MSTRTAPQGYLPQDRPDWLAMLSLGFQQVLTMFPATVLVAILTKFDIGATLLASGLGTIIALLVTQRRIPMYYGSSFSYIAVVQSAMLMYASDCYTSAATYCPEGVRLVQVGILGTAVLEILIGVLIMRFGRTFIDRLLPPVITGSVAIVIGISLAFEAIEMAAGAAVGGAVNQMSVHWVVAFITLAATILFSVYVRGKGLLSMLPILFGAVVGYLAALALGMIDFSPVLSAGWLQPPNVTLPNFADPRAWNALFSIALIAIATIPESTAHLYQMSLYIDTLADELKRPRLGIRNLLGLNLVADGADDLVVGLLGGCAGTNYGENNSLMAITRNYSVPVLITAGVIAILMSFIGKLTALVGTIPVAVTGGLSIYLFGVIGMQGIALLLSEKVNLFEPKNLALGAIILTLGIGGAIGLPYGVFPVIVPVAFPNGMPAIVFSALVGILVNLIFVLLPPKSAE